MKSFNKLPTPLAMSVAPRVGAWIEICYGIGWDENEIVAPRVGAWIEIICDFKNEDCI